MPPNTLLVYCEDHQVGELKLGRQGDLSFTYGETWLNADFSFPISISLPLAPKPYGHAAATFFSNLLPEGDVRTLVCRRFGISSDDDFGLLTAIGGECAGALRVLAEAPSPSPERGAGDGYEPLTNERLAALADSYSALATVDAGHGLRLSLAGAQDKLPVFIKGVRSRLQYFLPRGASASTHILKFPNSRFRHLPANEVVTMELAHRVGLPVAAVRWLDIGKQGLCLVERFDRKPGVDGKITRLHQEDFCQALGLPSMRKYETEGGPSFLRCLQTVKAYSTNPIKDVSSLIRWQIFNTLAGNSDGHAKNLAFVRQVNGLRLAPFYDLLSTHAIAGVNKNLAMKIDDVANPALLRGPNWARWAKSLEIDAGFVRDTVSALTDRVQKALPAVLDAFIQEHGESPALQRVSTAIRTQVRRIARQL